MNPEPFVPADGPCAELDEGTTDAMSLVSAGCPPDVNAQNLIRRVVRDPLISAPSANWPSGIPIYWHPGWTELRWCAAFAPRGLVIHHTATNWGYREDYPTLSTIINGNGTTSGPLAQFGLGRSGKIYVIAAGHANHAGPNSEGSWNPSGRPGEGLVTNTDVWGIEAENNGIGQAWPPAQIDAYHRLAAALARVTGFAPEMICAHREWRPRDILDKSGKVLWERKIDPFGIDANVFRSEVAKLMDGITPPPPPPPAAVPGNWVEKYGVDGFCLAAWSESSDYGYFPRRVLRDLQLGSGFRWSWGQNADPRSLESPDRAVRRATTFAGDEQVVVRMPFADAYSGTLHLYMVDFDRRDRRQVVTVEDEAGAKGQTLDAPFDQGAWMHFPVSVAAGGILTVTVDRLGSGHALLSGIFLGDAGPPPLPDRAPQGDWVGAYGADGFCLSAWDGPADFSYFARTVLDRLDLVSGFRYSWGQNSEVRSLESPDQSVRRATTFAHDDHLVVALHFADAYQGTLHLHMLDYDRRGRRQAVTVDDGSGPVTERVTLPFEEGVWLHFPVSVAAAGTVTVTVDRLGSGHALLSGIFLGDAGPPPLPDLAPQGDWVGAYGADGFCLSAWDGTTDVSSLPGASVDLVSGFRYSWGQNSDVRSLESPDRSVRRATTFAHDDQLVVALHIDEGYKGTLHLYMLDYDRRGRRQAVAVDDGSGPVTERVTLPFEEGVWLHFPVGVGASSTVTITVARLGGAHSLLAGIFLGEGDGGGGVVIPVPHDAGAGGEPS